MQRRLILSGFIFAALALAAAVPRAVAAATASSTAPVASRDQAAAQHRLDQLWPQVLAEAARPATWAARRPVYARLAAHPSHSEDERTAELSQQVATLETELRYARAIRRATGRDGACWGVALRNCRPLAGGRLASEDGAIDLVWQAQRGFTPEQGVRGGIVVRAPARRATAIVAWSYEGYDWQAPRLVEHRDRQFLAIAGRDVGAGNADLLYRRDGTTWREVQLERWKDDLRTRLPADMDVRKAVDYDFAAMTARMSLWREPDANCCPTGGEALARLDVEDDRLVLVDLKHITAVDLPRLR
ncbi:MAG: hypothetical protein J0H01_31650 [Rhizobiales bacterium]|nr:hypothetical protein [Hyphomicrobiales bacterium]